MVDPRINLWSLFNAVGNAADDEEALGECVFPIGASYAIVV
jgi:hypothetical protein